MMFFVFLNVRQGFKYLGLFVADIDPYFFFKFYFLLLLVKKHTGIKREYGLILSCYEDKGVVFN